MRTVVATLAGPLNEHVNSPPALSIVHSSAKHGRVASPKPDKNSTNHSKEALPAQGLCDQHRNHLKPQPLQSNADSKPPKSLMYLQESLRPDDSKEAVGAHDHEVRKIEQDLQSTAGEQKR